MPSALPRPMHHVLRSSLRSSASYSSRVRAIASPCPSAFHLSPRTSAIVASAVGCVIYLCWMAFLWHAHGKLGERLLDARGIGGVGERELQGLRGYTAWCAYFAATASVGWAGAGAASVWSGKEWLKGTSRLNWVTWIATWCFGVLGVVAYLASDEWLRETCGTTDDCWYFWRSIQFAVIVSLFTTLFLVFWFSVTLSSFTHALHPELFYDDSDSEDERWTRYQDALRAAVEYPETDEDEEEDARIARRHAKRRANSAKQRSVSRRGQGRAMVHTAVEVEPYRSRGEYYPPTVLQEGQQRTARRPAYTEEVDDEEEWTRPSSRPSSRPASRAPSEDEDESSERGSSAEDEEEGMRLIQQRGRRERERG